jgi:hypothetical protein
MSGEGKAALVPSWLDEPLLRVRKRPADAPAATPGPGMSTVEEADTGAGVGAGPESRSEPLAPVASALQGSPLPAAVAPASPLGAQPTITASDTPADDDAKASDPPRRLTRAALRERTQRVSYAEDVLSDENGSDASDFAPERGSGTGRSVRVRADSHKPTVRTPVVMPINRLPAVFARIRAAISAADNMRFDSWRTQNMLLAAAVDFVRFGGAGLLVLLVFRR